MISNKLSLKTKYLSALIAIPFCRRRVLCSIECNCGHDTIWTYVARNGAGSHSERHAKTSRWVGGRGTRLGWKWPDSLRRLDKKIWKYTVQENLWMRYASHCDYLVSRTLVIQGVAKKFEDSSGVDSLRINKFIVSIHFWGICTVLEMVIETNKFSICWTDYNKKCEIWVVA